MNIVSVKKYILIPFLFISLISSFCKPFTAQADTSTSEMTSKRKSLIFSGRLYIGNQSLGIIVKMQRNRKKVWIGKMDSPDQGAYDIPLDTVMMDKSRLHFVSNELEISFDGTLKGHVIEGVFKQSSSSFPLNLEMGEDGYKIKRPQTPEPPYPYKVKEVSIRQTFGDFNISGVVTIPKKKSKGTIILISGVNQEDRDATIAYHKPFAVLADWLTRNGYTVLRCDGRGIGNTGGDFTHVTTFDFAEDVDCEVNYMKKDFKPKSKRVFLIAHGEGAMVAPLVAQIGKNIDGMILLAAPSVTGRDVMIAQMAAVKESIKDAPLTEDKIDALKELFNVVITSKDKELAKNIRLFCEDNYERLLSREELNEVGKETLINLWVNQLSNPWMKFYLGYDPSIPLNVTNSKAKNSLPPTLAIYGELDRQIVASQNASAMKSLLNAPNKRYNVITLPGLNHLFQKAKSGSPLEYVQIDETINQEVLRIILEWLDRQR
ncbi:alpha/beta hydrolase [Falsiporphyromonas endometrii]|uniref:Alpha/beta hydrolase n=1 Tax=Falsiporphyromonas endometrii TaxID=1387297 RepID=A0ABV9K5D0_9PORP